MPAWDPSDKMVYRLQTTDYHNIQTAEYPDIQTAEYPGIQIADYHDIQIADCQYTDCILPIYRLQITNLIFGIFAIRSSYVFSLGSLVHSAVGLHAHLSAPHFAFSVSVQLIVHFVGGR
jgi:hypothetical protein